MHTKFYISVLVVLLVADCMLGGYIGWWRETYWSYVAAKNFSGWALYIGIFTAVALVSCFVSSKATYIGSLIGLDMRTKLTNKALELANHHAIEGGNQRVQEDCDKYPQLLMQIITGLFRSLVMILIFAAIILHQLNFWYLLIPIVYAAVGTLIAGKIALPLVNLNYINQVLEAKFRQSLTQENYTDVYANNKEFYRKTKHLQYFQSFYNQITVIFPHLVLAGIYFTSKISFGVFMQVASSMMEITNNLSYVINSFTDINRFLSCRKRLKELKVL
jgi:ABC-type uncharacterized transport system fused permease/ATPase subunit